MISAYLESRIKSIKDAFNGISSALKSEQNIQIQVVTGLILLPICMVLEITVTEWCFVLCCVSLVLSTELINTALEKLCDVITQDKNPKIGLIKDVAAGAVLVSGIISAIVGVLILGTAVYRLL